MLLMIYSVCSTGATIYMHHCGKRTLISLMDEAEVTHQQCPFCVEHHHNQDHSESDGSCCSDNDMCKDVQVELKNDTEQQQSSYQQLFHFYPAIVVLPWISPFIAQWLEESKSQQIQATPPQWAYENPVYILNCTFRI